jgi:hypothetical protein
VFNGARTRSWSFKGLARRSSIAVAESLAQTELFRARKPGNNEASFNLFTGLASVFDEIFLLKS